jgi:hypothetical protein
MLSYAPTIFIRQTASSGEYGELRHKEFERRPHFCNFICWPIFRAATMQPSMFSKKSYCSISFKIFKLLLYIILVFVSKLENKVQQNESSRRHFFANYLRYRYDYSKSSSLIVNRYV